MTGRSHNVRPRPRPSASGSPTPARSCSRRSAGVDDLLARYPLRGIKGPVGTQQDQLDLFDGDDAKVDELEQRVAAHLGFAAHPHQRRPGVPPLARPRRRVGARPGRRPGPSSLATTIRLMAGQELVTEGFKEGQVGSSAMPHKMNTRSCERINGFLAILRGHLTMVASLAGDQWNEGDVSLLGRPPGRAARRLPRHSTACSRPCSACSTTSVPTPPSSSASCAATCPSSPPPRSSWPPCGPASAASRRTRPSRSTPSRSRSTCARATTRTTSSSGWPPIPASACPPTPSPASSPNPSSSPAPPAPRSPPSSPRSTGRRRPLPRRRDLPPRRHPLTFSAQPRGPR